MSNELKATVRTQDDVAIIDMKGDVTSFADDTINSLVQATVDDGFKKCLFNFSEVSYINSSGIAILIGVITGLSSKGVKFKVYGLTPHFKKIFRMIGLTQYVTVYNSEADAIASF